MSKSFLHLRVGTRNSRLSRVQTEQALNRLKQRLSVLDFEIVECSTPGDRDRTTDLRASPEDFFTRDLDDAVLSGTVDAAVHSAKDLPESLAEGLDTFWLPWREDPRDTLILRQGETRETLPPTPRI